MDIIQSIISQYDFNLIFAKDLVKNLDHKQTTTKAGVGFENHPAFTIGYLATGSALPAEDLSGEYILPHGWKDLFEEKDPAIRFCLIRYRKITLIKHF